MTVGASMSNWQRNGSGKSFVHKSSESCEVMEHVFFRKQHLQYMYIASIKLHSFDSLGYTLCIDVWSVMGHLK